MIVITGAAGGVAGRLRLAGDVRRTDLVAGPGAAAGGIAGPGAGSGGPADPGAAARGIAGPGIVTGDLADPGFARDVIAGADAVVHLAGQADPDTPWSGLRVPNADVTANVLDAAVAAGVRRVVIASSLHAMAGHLDAGRTFVPEDLPPRACCPYGAGKVLGEQLARCYADVWGLSTVCLRLGGVAEHPLGRSWRGGWLSPADLNRLVAAALAVDVDFGVYHGVSANTPRVYGCTLPGYTPADDSAAFDDLPDDLTPPSPDRPRWGIAHRS